MPLPLSPAYAFISSPLLHVEDLTFVIKPCGPESALSFMKPAGPTQLVAESSAGCRATGRFILLLSLLPSVPSSVRPGPRCPAKPPTHPHPSRHVS